MGIFEANISQRAFYYHSMFLCFNQDKADHTVTSCIRKPPCFQWRRNFAEVQQRDWEDSESS